MVWMSASIWFSCEWPTFSHWPECRQAPRRPRWRRRPGGRLQGKPFSVAGVLFGVERGNASTGECRVTGLNTPLDSGGVPVTYHGTPDGAVAQLGERVVRNDEVRGSIPLSSTIRLSTL